MHVRFLAVIVTAALTTGCAAKYTSSEPVGRGAVAQPMASPTRHVILVSVDGLRPDAIDQFQAITLQRLMREGVYTLTAHTTLPSKTLPSHTSMLSGVSPDTHGVTWNNVVTAHTDVVDVSTVFSVARAQGYRTAAFFSKPKFQPLQRPETLDYSQAPGGWWGGWSASRTIGDAARYLEASRPNLLFVHLLEPDRAGHDDGWMSAAYGRAVREADAGIGQLLRAADRVLGAGQYAVIVTADHGGHERDHGSDDPRDVTIPWIAWGQGIEPDGMRPAQIQTFDTAPTVLSLLGIPTPQAWSGSSILIAGN